MDSGSGFGEWLREEMEVKHESGYRVTLQTVLMVDSNELERDGNSSGGSAVDSWMRATSIRPMTKVRPTRAEMMRVEMMGLFGWWVFWFES